MPRTEKNGLPQLTLILVVIALTTFTGTAAIAACEDGSAHAFFRMTTLGNPYDDCTVVVSGVLAEVLVYIASVPATRARFSVPDPSFGTVVNEQYFYPYTGDRVNGIEIDFGGCQPQGDTHIATFTVLIPTGMINGCVPWSIDPTCDIDDCNGVTRPASARSQQFSNLEGCCYTIDCPSLPPVNLFPADGAAEVLQNVVLSWTPPATLNTVRISTDPACYTGQTFYLNNATTFSPNFLLPFTTYYWQVSWSDGLECGGTSAIQSFTTTGTVPADQETWGRIKALYQ